MNKLFKDIRHSDIEAVRASISKNAAVVFYGKTPIERFRYAECYCPLCRTIL